VGYRGVREERRERRIVEDEELETLRFGAARTERERDVEFARPVAERAADDGRAILRNGPDNPAEARELHRAVEARQHRDNVRLGHRQLSGAEVEERMAEGVHAVAVDMRDGSRRAHLEVAPYERHANGIAGAQRG